MQQTSLVADWGTVDHSLRSSLALAMARLGPVYLGVTLYERDMDTKPGSVWNVEYGRDDGAMAGGHALFAWSYTGLDVTDVVYVGTWGYWQPATWAWFNARLDEAHGLVWRQLERADGMFYAGVTPDGLVADL